MIEKWFLNYIDYFPKINITLKNICVENIFALSGTNVVAVEIVVELTDNEGKEFQNRGVTMINTENGKAVLVRDYVFDPEMLTKSWGEGGRMNL